MCVSRFYKVLDCDGTEWVEVENVDHERSRASLLAYDGSPLARGEWVSVHSGYVIERVDPVEAASAVEEIRRAQASWKKGATL